MQYFNRCEICGKQSSLLGLWSLVLAEEDQPQEFTWCLCSCCIDQFIARSQHIFNCKKH